MSFLSSLFGTKSSSDQIKKLSPADFKQAIKSMNKTKQLVDVRTPSEFKSGHIKGAVNIDFFNTSKFMDAVEKYDKEIYDLQGGFMNWR